MCCSSEEIEDIQTELLDFSIRNSIVTIWAIILFKITCHTVISESFKQHVMEDDDGMGELERSLTVGHPMTDQLIPMIKKIQSIKTKTSKRMGEVLEKSKNVGWISLGVLFIKIFIIKLIHFVCCVEQN